MKKFLVFACLLILPLAASAFEIQVGPTVMYNWLLSPGDLEVGPPAEMTLDDFTFGAESRVVLGMLEVSGVALYSPGYTDPDYPDLPFPAELELFLDGGVVLDFVFIRAGIGMGPNFLFILDDVEATAPINLGGNIKLHCDLMVGDVSVSLNYMMLLADFSKESLAAVGENIEGLLGLSVLFKL